MSITAARLRLSYLSQPAGGRRAFDQFAPAQGNSYHGALKPIATAAAL